MDRSYLVDFDPHRVPSPAYVVDQGALTRNLHILDSVQLRTGCKILLALKGFAMFRVFPLIRGYLKGVCASSPHEARLGREEFRGEVHGHAPAYSEADLRELLTLCDHIVFNSFSQWQRFQPLITACPAPPQFGLRVNPRHSETEVAIYDPCAPGSRLGISREQFAGKSLNGISGLHFHTLCEKGSDALARTAEAFESQFKDILPSMQWLNLGGGHHITKPDYDLDLLCEVIDHFRQKYDLTIYLEPGEAIAIHTGALIATVLDIVENDGPIAILDTSVTCHMPDVLEMPYRPDIRGAGGPGELAHTYRLGGVSCLAGDVLGLYSFARPLQPGDRLIIEDMSHYTMVKTTTFNGVRLPSIVLYEPEADRVEVVREFGYEEYRRRLS
ncbi:MAG: carboxynorspermidine decarboxylase [Proteobacteria bacterium]|nr:carboxynorspermidine decarboxylase [Pseudomonadota bacterium]MBU4296583.1 carboxynorspermidine decarboxylase [Pseudomonadota bacterium]MCG2748836.1 carboxynorspermidine decarboxylase [Desulfobulbaceae bacterium]